MKSAILRFLIVLFLAFTEGFVGFIKAQNSQVPSKIAHIFELPEDKIDLGEAVLLLAKDAYPNLDTKSFDYVFDYMAAEIRRLVQGNTNPEVRIGALNTYLYRKGWWNDSLTFTYDLEDLEAAEKQNQYINGFLTTRKGSCITMPMLYLVLADRLQWPIKAVRSPKHFFARYIWSGFDENNIETTAGGGYITNSQYAEDVQIPNKAIRNGVYLRTLSKREYLATLLINNARHSHQQEHDLNKAIAYLKLALSADTTLSSAHWNLGGYYRLLARQLYDEYRAKSTELTAKAQSELLAIKQPYGRSNDYQSRVIKPKTTGNLGFGATIPSPSLPAPKTPQLSLKAGPKGDYPPPSTKTAFPVDIYKDILRMDIRQKIETLKKRYLPKIEHLLSQSDFHRLKATELGIVLEFPESFFRKQAQSIEEFQAIGGYNP